MDLVRDILDQNDGVLFWQGTDGAQMSVMYCLSQNLGLSLT